jgi:class I fructose-bisphosphate aldolase
MSGKTLRLKRFIRKRNGRIVILPLDHGVSCGPIAGLTRMGDTISMGVRGGTDALVLHKGMLRYLEPIDPPLPGVFLHLSASTQLGPSFHSKVLVGSVEEAIRRGADGVSMHINLGDIREPDMLEALGAVGAACVAWHMPLLVMAYVRGAHAPSPVPDSAIAHAARIAAELGADLIKIPPPADEDVMAAIATGIPVPVVVAGGSRKLEAPSFLDKIERLLAAGARGVAIGRNVFQHENPVAFLQAIVQIVHEGRSAREARAAIDAS